LYYYNYTYTYLDEGTGVFYSHQDVVVVRRPVPITIAGIEA
jgi:hypothetical protein